MEDWLRYQISPLVKYRQNQNQTISQLSYFVTLWLLFSLQDSYVLDYFHNISAFLSVGAPFYLVVPSGHNYTSKKGQNGICGGKGCPQDSLIGQVFTASLLPN